MRVMRGATETTETTETTTATETVDLKKTVDSVFWTTKPRFLWLCSFVVLPVTATDGFFSYLAISQLSLLATPNFSPPHTS